MALFTLVIKANYIIQNHAENCDKLFGLLKIDVALARSICSWGAQNTYKERHTLSTVDPHGSAGLSAN